jgi:hypothetical protein
MQTKEQNRRVLSPAFPCFPFLLLLGLAIAPSHAFAAEPPSVATQFTPQQRARLEEAVQLNAQIVPAYSQGKMQEAISRAMQALKIR